MSLDTTMRDTASRMLAKFGKAVEITQTTKTYVPATGLFTGVKTALVPIKAIVAEFEVGFAGKTDVRAGDLRITIAAKDMASRPASGDTVKIDGEVYKVVNAIPTYVSEEIAVWDLQVRK